MRTLQKGMGFDGLVVTDRDAISDRLKAFRAGCNLKGSGSSRINPWVYGSGANLGSQKITPCQVKEKVKLELVKEEDGRFPVTNMYDYLIWV